MLLLLLVSSLWTVHADPTQLHALKQHRIIAEALEVVQDELEGRVYQEEALFGISHVIESLAADQTGLFSAECKEDIGLIVQGIVQLKTGKLPLTPFQKQGLLPMLDSCGRVGPALLKGHIYFAGHYSECAAIDAPVERRQRNFRAAYFKIGMDIAFRPNSMNTSCVPVSEMGIIPEFSIGLCLPASCSSKELMQIFRPDTGNPVIPNPVCEVLRTDDTIPPMDTGFYISVIILGGIAIVCVLFAIIDFFFCETAEKLGYTKSLPWRLFIAFSLYSNVASIFDVSTAQKDGQIGPLNCIRFFSFSWVVIGHFFSYWLQIAANSFDVMAMGKDILSEFIMTGTFAVDSFFFLSGLLLSFIWFKTFRKDPAATNSVRGWIMFYVHRILRLTPAYYMALIFFAFVYKQLMRGFPLNLNFFLFNDDFCRENWYIDLLYAHNWWQPNKQVSLDLSAPFFVFMHAIGLAMFNAVLFVSNPILLQCMGVSWYLASELQMFLFTPLLLLPLAIKPVLGLLIAAIVFIISTGANIFLVYHYHWPTSFVVLYTPDPEETNFGDYNELMYFSPLIRCQIYIIGILVGWLLQSKRNIEIHPLINLAAWIVALSLMLTVTLGLHDQSNGFIIPIFWRAMYSSLSRVAWGVGLSWIIVSCYYGYGGPINAFMSWHIWIPLGRLTYCGYLIHIPIMMLVLAQSTDDVYFTTFLESFTRIIAIIFVALLASVFWSACFEISFAKVQSILLGGRTSSAKNQEEIVVEKMTVSVEETAIESCHMKISTEA